ncbi:hypothetical protein [Williamsia phyllosphaerae]|uniref:Terminase small subunit n=1 Tax=Williamsia phyllosphaerae TaxID=885042 RepID=A0ABQ1V4T5_9NOCA|nr:hypothetical protein [Williamsia phyllosphaerae]GGF39024.1 hypothetical protein GCM10007298_38410 [Williamsia phyllosphaerae]
MAVKRSHVRVVAPGEQAVPAKVLSLNEAIESGDYLEILRAQRRDIVSSLPDERGPAKAALHRQLALISKEIQALEARGAQAAREDAEGVAVDDEAWDAEAL